MDNSTNYPSKNNPFKAKQFPKLDITRAFERIEDLTTIPRHQYCRPFSKNFESVDSFTIMSKQWFDEMAKDEDVLVGFQMTVSAKHPVNGSGLKRVRERVEILVKKKLPIYLVFISDSKTMVVKQPINTDKGETMVRDGFVDKQFVLCFEGKFAEWTKLTRDW